MLEIIANSLSDSMSLETLSLKIKEKVSVQIIRVSGPQPNKIIEAYHWYLAANFKYIFTMRKWLLTNCWLWLLRLYRLWWSLERGVAYLEETKLVSYVPVRLFRTNFLGHCCPGV